MARSDLRAVFGGLELGIAGARAACARRPAWRPAARCGAQREGSHEGARQHRVPRVVRLRYELLGSCSRA